MRNVLLTSVAVTALIAGMATAGAQMAPGSRGDQNPAAESTQQAPRARDSERNRQPRAPAARSESREPGARAQQNLNRQDDARPGRSTTGQASPSADQERSAPQRGEMRDERRDRANQDRTSPRRGEAREERRDRATQDRTGPRRGETRDERRDRASQDRPARQRGDARDERRDRATQDRSPSRERGTTGQSREDRSADAPRRGDRQRVDSQRDNRSSRGSMRMSDEQRSRVGARFSERIDRMNVRPLSRSQVSVSIGATIPRSVHLYAVPRDIVTIYPQFRNHQFVVVEDEIVIVEPSSHRIVAVLPQSGERRAARGPARETTGSAAAGARLRLSPEERSTIRTVVTREPSCRLEQRLDFFLFMPVPRTVEVCTMPPEVVSAVPELSSYRYVVRGDEIVLVDPDDYRVVEIIR